MSETLGRIVEFIRRGEIRVSAHGYDEMAEDPILAREAIEGITASVVIED